MRRTNPSARSGRGLLCAIALAAALLVPAAQAAAAGAGYWHTSGNKILDANGQQVRITGINWYGFETTDKVIHGMWAQDWHNIVNLIKANGYTVVRMPFSDDFVSNPINPTNIGASNGSGPMNRDVIGLDSLTIMDKVIQQLGDLGIRVILDNHRSAGGNSADESGLWYTAAYSEQTMIANWVTLVKRYQGFKDPQGNPIVIGVDLRNEPHLNVAGSPTGACWTGDTATGGCPSTSNKNWPKAAERIGDAILAANSNLLVIVEGAECYNGDCDWWGGNLMGVASQPVVLNVPNRIVYSAHDYGPALFQQKWFNANTTCDSLATVWDHYFGYISAQGIAPVLIGEFGANNGAYSGTTPGSQGQWFQCMITYIKNRPLIHWTYWAFNGEDDYGLVDAQYNPTLPAPGKQALLASLQSPLEGGGGISCATPNIPQSFSATAVSSGQIDLKWSAVPSPGAGCAVTYSVFRSTNGTTITASPSTQVASGITGTSWSDTTVAANTQYYYLVEAMDVTVASPPSSKASAMTPQGTGTSYALTVTRAGTTMGTITSNVGGINCGTACSATYPSGTIVTLTEAPSSGFVFVGWSGACTGTSPTCVVTMSAAQAVGAAFNCTGPTLSLTVTKSGTGSGTVVSTNTTPINCGATCSFTTTSCGALPTVTLTATPAAGSTFAGWSGPCTGTASTCSFVLSGTVAVGAAFSGGNPGIPLSVTKTGAGTGTVVSSSGGINCGATCGASFPSGTVVTLTATATAGSQSIFGGWSGPCTGTTPTCVVTMSTAQAVTASFQICAAPAVTLTVAKAGTGTGTVTSSPAGISCGSTCTMAVSSCGTVPVVVLTATPSAGSTFTGWSGACTGTATCSITLSAPQSVTATFTLAPGFPLTVTKTGVGAGTVVSTAAGINCGTTCSATLPSGTIVTLTAAAASGSIWGGWSGACTGTASTCVVTMSAAQSVSASFVTCAAPAYALTVTKAGTGTGTVTSSPAGISCGSTCTMAISSCGTVPVVVLTATPSAGSTFTGWSGACSGTTSACSLTLSGPLAVTATFAGGTTPCANPITFTNNTGNFNTTAAACYRTSQTVNGWGCSNTAGRTISVNGGTATATCGAGPFPLAKSSDGYTYFSATAGQYAWASIYLW